MRGCQSLLLHVSNFGDSLREPARAERCPEVQTFAEDAAVRRRQRLPCNGKMSGKDSSHRGGNSRESHPLAHPSLVSADGEPAPVLAVAEIGRGRTMALTVDVGDSEAEYRNWTLA